MNLNLRGIALKYANRVVTEFWDSESWALQQRFKIELVAAYQRGYLQGQADATRKETHETADTNGK